MRAVVASRMGHGLQIRRGMATQPAKNTTDVLQILTSQHTEVDALFERIEKGNGDRKALLLELADKLAAHATVEEKIFYPAVMAKSTSDTLHESVEEHLQIKRVLSDLLVMNPDDENFKAKVKVLKEDVSHHAHEEEEEKLFVKVRSMMGAEQLAAIGNDVLAMFEDLMQGNPSKNVPAETKKAAPLPQPNA